MNKIYFRTAEEALNECDDLTDDDTYDSDDRATINAFYNGRQTMSDCEAEKKGLSELTNHLFGYDSIQSAAEQIFSIYSKSPILYNVDIMNAPEGVGLDWSQKVTKYLNEAIKHSGRFKPEFKAFSGEVALDGSFHFVFYDNEDWCPRARRPLAPRGTGTVPSDGDYFALREDLRLKDLYAYKAKAERLRDQGFSSGWNIIALGKAIQAIEKNDSIKNTERRDYGGNSSRSEITPEEAEMDFQSNTSEAERQRLTLPVYFLYTSRPQEEGTPFDMTIIARFPVEAQEGATEKGVVLDLELFDKERYYPRASDFLHSFFIDCAIGGKTLWHRSLGLGRLNFDSDVDVEEYFNEAMQGSKENLRRQYVVGNAADTESVNRWLSGEEYSNVLPEGVTIAEVAKQNNFQYAFGIMDVLQNLSRKHGASHISNKEGAQGTNELEVQALERQGRNAEAIANKMNDIYDGLTRLGETQTCRFLNDNILPSDRGYEEINFFQEKMKEEGVPLAFLRKKKNGRFVNIRIKVNRVAGDGDKVREQMVSASLMQNLHLYSPQSQELIKRRDIAIKTQDYEFAEEIVPREQELDGGQINVANNENQTMIQRGITGYVSELNRDDITIIHLGEHLGGLQGLLAKGEIAGWDELDMGGFQSIIQHTGKHLQQVRNNPAQKQIATQVTQTLQGMMRQAQEFANNLQAKREAEQKQMEPKDLARLQLDGAKLEQSKQEHSDLVQHREKSLELARAKAGSNSRLQLNQQNLTAQQGETKALLQADSQNANQSLKMLELEQKGVQDARQEVLSGQRESQGRQAQ